MSGGKKREYVNWMNEDGVATLTLSNGPLNVLNGGVSVDLLDCVDEIRGDSSARVVVVTGAGERAFSAGGDIKDFPKVLGKEDAKAFWRRNRAALENFAALPQPTIAAINGLAYGGGFELALVCDLRVASETAKFCLPEIKIGLFPDGGGTQRLPRLVGASRAKGMMFFGEPISAEEAFRIGLVDRIVPSGQALQVAQGLARRLANMPVMALRSIKKAVDEGLGMTLQGGLQLEGELFDEIFQSEDAQEGIRAFIEKRPPQFRSR
jgi:enoyl-CoA hydratase/carnithine racemase